MRGIFEKHMPMDNSVHVNHVFSICKAIYKYMYESVHDQG